MLALPRPIRYVDEEHLAYIRKQRCALKGKPGHTCWGSVQACHIKTRGAGGGDDQVFPGCAAAHGEQEGHTAEFETKWKIDLREIAEWYWTKHNSTRVLPSAAPERPARSAEPTSETTE